MSKHNRLHAAVFAAVLTAACASPVWAQTTAPATDATTGATDVTTTDTTAGTDIAPTDTTADRRYENVERDRDFPWGLLGLLGLAGLMRKKDKTVVVHNNHTNPPPRA